MKYLITGGGTGGHIYPALAIAKEIKNRHKDLIRQIDNREIITEGEYDYIRLQQTKENLQQREKDPYIIIDRELEYKSLNDLLTEIEHKNVKVTLKVYRSKEVRYLLKQI